MLCVKIFLLKKLRKNLRGLRPIHMPNHSKNRFISISNFELYFRIFILKYPEYFICKSLPHKFYISAVNLHLFKLLQPVYNSSCQRPCNRLSIRAHLFQRNNRLHKSFLNWCKCIEHLFQCLIRIILQFHYNHRSDG